MDNPSVGYNAASVLQSVYVPTSLIPSAAYAANVTYDYASGQAIAYGTPDGYANSYVAAQGYVTTDSGVYVDGQGYYTNRGYSPGMSGGYMQYRSGMSAPPSPNSSDPSKPKKQKVKGQGGSSCHQCKSRRNFTALTYCTSNLDKKNKKCRKKFCGHCLKKFYKETPQAIADKTSWRCPSCRKLCCCAACRRRKTKEAGGSGNNSPISKGMSGIPGVMVPISGPGGLGPSIASLKLLRKQKKQQQSDSDSDSDSDNSPLPYAPDSPYPPPAQRDVAVPPVPTVMMSTSEMSSPMNTPLQAPSHLGFQGDELILKGDSDGADEFDASRHRFVSSHYHSEEEGPLPYSPPHGPSSPPSPSVHYLTATVRKHARAAREAVSSGFTTPFARMYNQWNHNQELNKKVQMTIGRPDLTTSQQVKTIAQMLRSADQYPQAFMETKDFGLDFPPDQFPYRAGFPVPLPYQPSFLVPFPRSEQSTEEFVPPYAWAPDQYPQYFTRPVDVSESLSEA